MTTGLAQYLAFAMAALCIGIPSFILGVGFYDIVKHSREMDRNSDLRK